MRKRVRVLIKGIVQGVGFRPFLYRCAKKYNLSGFVKNTSQGVILEVEGRARDIEDFVPYILNHPPPLSLIEHHETRQLPLQHSGKFYIVPSEDNGETDLLVSPDIAVCENCLDELFSPNDRRSRYPFINCTDCGPRFSIIQGLPYDRPRTSMKAFQMCPTCTREYEDPYDRRYHAQPISCYQCGPSLSFHGPAGDKGIDPLETAAQKIKGGGIVAVKGLAGYHLACLACLEGPILRLRELKGRETKPFALMATLEMIKQHAYVSDKEKALLLSPASPIMLLKRKKDSNIAGPVAPGLKDIGFMVPYTPIHLLLLEKIKEPLVMTSANITDEPIIYKDEMTQLKALADSILKHDRDIHIFADDSVVQVFEDQFYMVRRSRGYVPMPLKIPIHTPKIILALGPMLKTTFTFLYRDKALVSQYIGDTDSPASIEAERTAIAHFMKLFSLKPDILVLDKHPGYPNRQIAEDFPQAQVMEVQHHQAHVGALVAERGELGEIIGISMDGTGYGDDGAIWGGEFFVGDYRGLTRFGHLKYIFLPSGDKSAKEPWRFALSLAHSLYGLSKKTLDLAKPFGLKGERVLETIKKRIAGIQTSSCGRLFDAVASILDIGHVNSYEGELPMLLQARAEASSHVDETYPFYLEKEENIHILNLLPTIHDIIEDERDEGERAFVFHNTLARGMLKMAETARDEHNINKVGLTGGVFQNTLLLSLTKDLLTKAGFSVLIHSQVPANDGGISLGQAFLAAGHLQDKEK